MAGPTRKIQSSSKLRQVRKGNTEIPDTPLGLTGIGTWGFKRPANYTKCVNANTFIHHLLGTGVKQLSVTQCQLLPTCPICIKLSVSFKCPKVISARESSKKKWLFRCLLKLARICDQSSYITSSLSQNSSRTCLSKSFFCPASILNLQSIEVSSNLQLDKTRFLVIAPGSNLLVAADAYGMWSQGQKSSGLSLACLFPEA